jgi:hypothetical protein
MMISILANLLASAVITTSAAAAPANTCGSPIYDSAHDCAVIADGMAKLQCTAMADGSVKKCKVILEDPAGKGYVEAALAKVSDGKPHLAPDPNRPATGALVAFPMRFKAGE